MKDASLFQFGLGSRLNWIYFLIFTAECSKRINKEWLTAARIRLKSNNEPYKSTLKYPNLHFSFHVLYRTEPEPFNGAYILDGNPTFHWKLVH